MEVVLKSNIEEIKKDHHLTKKDIDLFANNLAVSFQGYPLFEYFANYKYDDELKRYQSDCGYLTLEAVYQILNDNKETRKIEWI